MDGTASGHQHSRLSRDGACRGRNADHRKLARRRSFHLAGQADSGVRAKNPGIKVVFAPSAPTEYDAALGAKLDAGSAGDLITCRPFDKSLELFQKGKLADLTDCPAWRISRRSPSPPGRPTTARRRFCVPMASVIHGFIYNKEAFDKLGITVPQTEDEFFAALEKIKADGTYIPMAMGTKDLWEAATMGYQNIGPNYWKGEEGRLALIKGDAEADRSPVGRALSRRSPSGSLIWATASRPRPIRTARTCSRSAAPPSTRPARGRFRASTPRPSSRWAPSRRRSRRPATPATSPTTPISAMGMNAKTERRCGQDLPDLGSLAGVRRPSMPTRCRASSA
jgi:hypothetical protein